MTGPRDTVDGWLHAEHMAREAARGGAGFGVLTPELKAGLHGFAVLTGMIDGTLPVPESCGKDKVFLVWAGPGCAVMQGHPGAHHLNPAGTVEGGWMAKILDLTMGSALLSLLPPDHGYLTAAISVRFRQTLRPGALVRADARLPESDISRAWRFGAQGRRPTFEAYATLRGVLGEVYADAEAVFQTFRDGAGS